MAKKLLIFQFRNGFLKDREQQSFARMLGIPPAEISFVDAHKEKKFEYNPADFRGVIIAGAGDYFLSQGGPDWIPNLIGFIKKCIGTKIPVLGVCLGHQLLGMLYGAKIVADNAQKELGTVEIKINDKGGEDPLFKGMDGRFFAMAGHNDSVIDPPKEFQILAGNSTCRIQAFRVRDTNVYGVQFHPEMTEKDFRERLEYYREHYVEQGVDINDLIARGEMRTNAEKVLKNFAKIAAVNSK